MAVPSIATRTRHCSSAVDGVGSAEDCLGGGLSGVPSDLTEHVLPRALEMGAKLHTNSWGTTSTAYSQWALQVDTFLWEHPEMLVLFAAGNDGEFGERSVGAPGDSKSALTVGASNSGAARWAPGRLCISSRK